MAGILAVVLVWWQGVTFALGHLQIFWQFIVIGFASMIAYAGVRTLDARFSRPQGDRKPAMKDLLESGMARSFIVLAIFWGIDVDRKSSTLLAVVALAGIILFNVLQRRKIRKDLIVTTVLLIAAAALYLGKVEGVRFGITLGWILLVVAGLLHMFLWWKASPQIDEPNRT